MRARLQEQQEKIDTLLSEKSSTSTGQEKEIELKVSFSEASKGKQPNKSSQNGKATNELCKSSPL